MIMLLDEAVITCQLSWTESLIYRTLSIEHFLEVLGQHLLLLPRREVTPFLMLSLEDNIPQQPIPHAWSSEQLLYEV